MTIACNAEPYVPNTLLKEFLVAIEIPIGFKLQNAGIENSYTEYITIDRNSISRMATKTPVMAEIQMPNGSMMPCTVEANTLTLKGTIIYNAVLAGFVPENGVPTDIVEGQIIVSNNTAFSHSGIVDVDDVVVYGCPGCDLDTWYLENYHVELVEGNAFVVNNEGDVFVNDNPGSEFFNQLNNSENAQIVNVPLQLRLVKNVVTP